MSREEVLNEITKLCKENNLYYYIQLDDGDLISGAFRYRNGSKLNDIANAGNAYCDKININ